ncbi:KpsF/GutQ family sugar-phosphate isomerase [candidate division GN15 bacterium]|nr:KpsF/GutQ family sugar-phosphate isomerase [candidate division GN15 bacterium]
MDHRERARQVIEIEAEAVRALTARLGESFDRAVDALLRCNGRVIVTGMGKSGLIGRKIAATFNSTGVSSMYMHPAEALHGDLGLVRADDILLVISKSGQMQEMGEIISAARRLGVTIIALVGNTESELYNRTDIALDCSVEKEACPNNLVPTSSSTAALVMGDALAVAMLEARDFKPDDFAALHPAGFLGRRLLKRVSEFHHVGDEIPIVSPQSTLSQMMVEMSAKRLGCVLMTDDDRRVSGFFTDGDLRRLWERERDQDMIKLTAADVMIRNPKTISEDILLDAALALMEKHAITQLATVDDDGRLAGIIHLHDILKSKLV